MRYGVLSDIHANAPALDAVIARARKERVDGFICPGDVVGYGPHPNECVDTLAGLDAVCVAGNHDLVAIGELGYERLNPLATSTLEWTTEVLSDASRDFLRRLPASALVDEEVVVAHGSLTDPQTYVKRPEQALAQIEQAHEQHAARIVLLGHTHRAWAVGEASGEVAVWPTYPIGLSDEPGYLLNAGSVGQSREARPVARLAILDLERNVMDFHAISYDHRSVRKDLKQAGLPENACHVRPSLPGVIKQARRKLLRR